MNPEISWACADVACVSSRFVKVHVSDIARGFAGRDRVAIDAVGVALLRSYGSTPDIMKGRIFDLEQIRRAAELGVGVPSASDIKLTPLDDESRETAKSIQDILDAEG